MAGTKNSKKSRLLDLVLSRSLAEGEKNARALIMAGQVVVGDQMQDKPGMLVDSKAEIRVKSSSKYVSRGGEKLEGAIGDFGLAQAISGTTALDIGASTGGFTECLLNYGASEVIALDVGTHQLHQRLRSNPRVHSVERTNIRDFQSSDYPKIDLVVGDISFNSLARLRDPILAAAPETTVGFLLLVKPQFELDRSEIGEGGVVADANLQKKAVNRVIDAFTESGLTSQGAYKSTITGGKKGNQEYFVLLTR